MIEQNRFLEAVIPREALHEHAAHERIWVGEGFEDVGGRLEGTHLGVGFYELGGGLWVFVETRDDEVGVELGECS